MNSFYLLVFFSSERTVNAKLLLVIRQMTGMRSSFTTGNSASAHRDRNTFELLRFILPDQWPPNSSDLNPVDYKI